MKTTTLQHVDAAGRTLLTAAIEKGYREVVDWPPTLLISAICQGVDFSDVASSLLKRMSPAAINLRLSTGANALQLAVARECKSEFLRELVHAMDFDTFLQYGKNIFVRSLVSGNEQLTRFFLEKFSNTKPFNQGKIVQINHLINAIFWGWSNIAMTLIDNMTPEELAKRDACGRTAIRWAFDTDVAPQVSLKLIEKTALVQWDKPVSDGIDGNQLFIL